MVAASRAFARHDPRQARARLLIALGVGCVVAALVPSAAEFQQPVEFPAPDTADKVPAFAVIAAPEDAPAASDAQPSADPQPASASQPVADAQPAAAG